MTGRFGYAGGFHNIVNTVHQTPHDPVESVGGRGREFPTQHEVSHHLVKCHVVIKKRYIEITQAGKGGWGCLLFLADQMSDLFGIG